MLDVLAELLGRDRYIRLLGLDALPASELDGLGGEALAELRHRRQDVAPPPGCPPGQSIATMMRVGLTDDELDALGLDVVKDVRVPAL